MAMAHFKLQVGQSFFIDQKLRAFLAQAASNRAFYLGRCKKLGHVRIKK